MWTKQQLEVINSLDAEMLVSASAGSGKTTVMLERVLEKLKNGVSLSEMVICTYTKASASDMKAKLYKKLLGKNEKWARNAMRELPLAQISTLHSFCQTLIKDFFYFVDVSPDFKVLSENEASSMLRSAIEKSICESGCLSLECGINEEFNNNSKLQTSNFTLLYEVMLKNRSHYPLANTIFDIYSKAQSMENFEGFLEIGIEKSPQETLPLVKALIDLTKSARKIYTAQKQKIGKIDYSDFEELVHRILIHDEAKQQIAQRYKYIFIDEYQDANYSQEKIINALIGEKFFVGDVKQSIYGFRNSNPKIFVKRYERYCSTHNDCESEFENQKNSDNNSKLQTPNPNKSVIELNTNFRSQSGILEFCNDLFSSIMTKEFGQVDYVNDAKFSFLTHGDCKTAEVSGASRNKSVNSKNIQLHIITKEKDLREKTPIDKVYSIKEDEGTSEKSRKEEQVYEAYLVASYIDDLISGGAEFSDIAVLLRGTDSSFAKTLKSILSKHDIPFSASKKRKANESRPVLEVINFLKAIQNPHDDIALASAMMSSFGKFDLGQLKEIGDGKAEGSFYERCLEFLTHNGCQSKLNHKKDNRCAFCVVRSALQNFFTNLSHFKQLSFGLNVPTLLGRIISQYDFFKIVYAYADGKNMARELSLFLDFVAECSFSANLFEFLSHIENADIVLEMTTESDSVYFGTIHSSKGLEYEHVILPNLSKKFNLTDLHKKVLIDNDFGFAIKHHCVETRQILDTSFTEFLKEKIEKEQKEEEMRLLYVALTRAKKSIFMSGISLGNEEEIYSQDAKSFFDWIMKAKDSKHLDIFYHNAANYDGENYSKDKEDEKNNNGLIRRNLLLGEECEERKTKLTDNFIFEYVLDKRLLKTTVTQIAKEDGGDEDFQLPKINGQLPIDIERASKIGNAYHKIMQLLNFEKDFVPQYKKINSELKNLVNEKKIKKAFLDMKGLTSGKKYYKEKAFIYKNEVADNINSTTNSTLLIQGVIDLIIDNGSDILIVDYKSGKSNEKMNKSYEKQLEIYKTVTENLLKKPTKTMLYFFEE
ncbi:MAG: UvrD-helicase domain-containing protein [Firmicutes bacterium]|nr:UvrD-helicase domain-containing protein [Bacillota bacterium]